MRCEGAVADAHSGNDRRLLKYLRDRLEADEALAQRVVARVLELRQQRDEARRACHEANALLHRLDMENGTYSSLSRRRKLNLLEALLRAANH